MPPSLGVGIGYRRRLDREISDHGEQIDWLEIVADNYLPLTPRRRAKVETLAASHTCIPHGVDLSVGSPDKPSAHHLQAYVELVKLMAPPWHSDHLAYTQVGGINLVHFMPPPRDYKTVVMIADRVKEIQDLTQTLFLLENVAATFDPGGAMSRAEFSNAVAERAECGLLLDLANLYADATNFKFDPLAYMDQLDLSRVIQVHIAGGTFQDGWLRDTHSRPVPDAVWGLLDILASGIEPCGILLERDTNFPPFQELLNELQKARHITRMAGVRRQSAQDTVSPPLIQLRANGGAAPDYLDRNRPAVESGLKRWENLRAWFPATVRAMSSLYGGQSTNEAVRDLATRYPRVISDDNQLGFREAELSRYRDLLRDHARHSPELEALIDFEATVTDLRLSVDSYTGATERMLDWEKFTASPSSFPQAHLELTPFVRLISLPVNAVQLKEQVLAGFMGNFNAHRDPVDLCLHFSLEEVLTIYKPSTWQRAILLAAQKCQPWHTLLDDAALIGSLPDGSLVDRVGLMIGRGMVSLADDSREALQ